MTKPSWALLLALMCLAGGCGEHEATAPPAELRADDRTRADEPELQRITGSLTYRARIALPPQSHALIELRDAAAQDDDGRGTLASQRIDLVGRQVPISFAFDVPRQALRQANAYVLRATIFERDRPAWLSEPLAVNHRVNELDVGELLLLPRRGAAFSSILDCGRLQISAGYAGDDLLLDAAGRRYVMLPVPSASGARYQASGELNTEFWTEGDSARLTLDGEPYPLCVPPGGLALPFRAFGRDRPWQLTLDDDGLRFGEPTLSQAGIPYRITGTDNRQRTVRSDDGDVTLDVEQTICRDSASGLVYPQTATLQRAGQSLSGCAGDPLRLLRGTVWEVQAIDGEPVLDQSPLTLEFRGGNQLTGLGSCNNFTGEYQLAEQGLTFTQAVTTMKACAPELLEQERRYLRALEGIAWFDFNRDGELLLQGDENRSIRARERPVTATAAP